jgi:hypothetical protein
MSTTSCEETKRLRRINNNEKEFRNFRFIESDSKHNTWGTTVTKDVNIDAIMTPYMNIYNKIKDSCIGYRLDKIVSNHTEANRYAISECCDNFQACLFGVGSIVCYDNASLRKYQTVTFDSRKLLEFGDICDPEDVRYHNQFIPMPYYIPGCNQEFTNCNDVCISDNEESMMQRDKHFINLFRKHVFQRIRSFSTKVLFLEPMLSVNGAILTDYFMKGISGICHCLHIQIVTNERLTFGYVPNMLYSLSCGFESMIKFITVCVGPYSMVLRKFESDNYYENIISEIPTSFDLTDIYNKLDEITQCNQLVCEARGSFIRKHALNELYCWGSGGVIFCPIARTGSDEGLFKVNGGDMETPCLKVKHLPEHTICQCNSLLHTKMSAWKNKREHEIGEFITPTARTSHGT